ncbi:glycoside hydrolase family 2 TIM barrel-domain containing protein [Spirosoma flavum]|uniref:Glycoside hydrolase family 2 TIM barrel-domain containing protein n=1 Tax=Spirosoma flavum TaxID=2048557 RepID=A0ABW6AGZ7_9BACT
MKKQSIFLSILLLIGIAVRGLSAAPEPRQRLLMDYGWKFMQADINDADTPAFDDRKWRTLNLPHDWSIEGEFKEDAPTKGNGGYLPTGIGWYRKHFSLSSIPKAQTIWIEFDGVYMNSDVWINGHHLGKHPYGYTSFHYALTPFLKKGDNIIAVRVDNSVQPNSRWYSGSGIYRHVWLNLAGPVHVAQWGTYITTPSVEATSATVGVRTSLENNLPTTKNVVLRSVITDAMGKQIATLDTPVSLSAAGKTDVEQTLLVASPALWSIETPSLYTLHTVILEGTKLRDSTNSPFGIRKLEYDRVKGFFLNGKHVKMNGVCLHHDGGALGAAVPEQAWVRRLRLLKEMGCNAIRTAHNPPAPEFLDLCDKMGFLVMDEAFDEWEVMKGQVDRSYHLQFAEWSQRDLLSMIHRDRNHPSIVIWSAGNEVPDQTVDRGQEVLKQLIETLHREDPTRPVTVANDKIAAGDGPAKLPFLDLEDIVGYNYVDRWNNRRELYYSADRYEHPNWKVIGTEHTAVRGTRGIYNLSGSRPGAPDYRTGMIAAEQLWKFTAINDYVIGDFMWAGIDFLGEAQWPNKNSGAGVIDLSGFPKDGYYFYQSQWTQKPMVHGFPHWNWAGNEGKVIPIIAYTNCESVELFLNDKSFGKKSTVFPQQGHTKIWNKYDRPFISATTSDLHLSWDVPYEPGTLTFVGTKDGQVITEEIRTTSKPTAIRLSVDRNDINADAWDIANVNVEVVDANGLPVPDADNLIEFTVEGEGILLATDNGNPQDRTTMKSKQRKAFGGLALAIIQSIDKPGAIRIRAVSQQLNPADLQISSHKPANAPARAEQLR